MLCIYLFINKDYIYIYIYIYIVPESRNAPHPHGALRGGVLRDLGRAAAKETRFVAVLFTRCVVARQLRSPKPIEKEIYDQSNITLRLVIRMCVKFINR